MITLRRCLCLLFLAPWAFALETAYLSFDHPQGWNCELSQSVWICQSKSPIDRKESVVLSIAAQATDWDTLDNYLNYLKTPRKITDDKGKTVHSKIIYARKRKLNGVEWVDSLHQNSELPGFWTRYLGTVHQTKSSRLAILVTYIVSQERYKNLSPIFERMVSSLKPRNDFESNIASKQGDQVLPGSTVLGQKMQDTIMERLAVNRPEEEEETEIDTQSQDQLLILLGAGFVVAYILIRARRKARQKTGRR